MTSTDAGAPLSTTHRHRPRSASPVRISDSLIASVPTLDELASDPARADELPVELVAQLQTRALQVLNVLWGRLLAQRTVAPAKASTEDRLLDVAAAAERLGVSRDWIYRRADTLPFTVRQGRLVRFSEAGLAKYIRTRTGPMR